MADTTLLRTAYLIAPDSPRQAFYHLRLEQTPLSCRVVKASGAGGRVWHRQVWEFATLAQAEAMFAQRLRQKTNPIRRSQRKYRLQHLCDPAARKENEADKAVDLSAAVNHYRKAVACPT